jgi:hypothetical protein
MTLTQGCPTSQSPTTNMNVTNIILSALSRMFLYYTILKRIRRAVKRKCGEYKVRQLLNYIYTASIVEMLPLGIMHTSYTTTRRISSPAEKLSAPSEGLLSIQLFKWINKRIIK